MRVLESVEVVMVSGCGTLHDPITNPQSEVGKAVNDIAGGLNEFGEWVGSAVYDLFN